MPENRQLQADALAQLITEVRSSFHLLRALAQQVHGGPERTAARRGVMLDLLNRGSMTVPELARLRPVSRQHIQVVVNGLLDEGWVEMLDNPAHRRSRLVSLTDRGRQVVQEMIRRERDLLSEVLLPLEPAEIAQAASVLREARTALTRLIQ